MAGTSSITGYAVQETTAHAWTRRAVCRLELYLGLSVAGSLGTSLRAV